MERIKMVLAAVLMGAVAIAGLGFGLMALLVVSMIGAVALLAARIAAPVLIRRMEAMRGEMEKGAGKSEEVVWVHVAG